MLTREWRRIRSPVGRFVFASARLLLFVNVSTVWLQMGWEYRFCHSGNLSEVKSIQNRFWSSQNDISFYILNKTVAKGVVPVRCRNS